MFLSLFLACAGAPELEPIVKPVAEPAPAAVPAPVVDPVPAPVAEQSVPLDGYSPCKEEWRGGGCTREHRDTCGILGDGTKQTFANPCVACQKDIVGWKDGACP